ncbi:GAF sensor signal transduction histidine kinase [Thermobaculum terrenum ATCC BAA-798]|uniref:histidine kinase n=1 Tax=Thermobaculum terrenum (strain ATCC BAA-798 / CCMEE 7001 / YNP1) TaxID=525904 RepID=D1CGU8_THET1|nr:DUF4118 domain-containing protein [Thermobaculum terrenum]ACZ42969.1 GAF sensor signal transduction histidine kinase [Thermobaculum terrenum ATCC BAA-798]
MRAAQNLSYAYRAAKGRWSWLAPLGRGRWSGYLLAIGGVAAITRLISLVFTRWHIANISMIYLLLVLALAVLYGSGPAVLASVAAFLAFDWFFVQPTWSLTIRDPDEWLALCLFLVTALITGQLAGNLRSREAQLHRRARELEVVNDLTRSILLDVNLEGLLRRLVTNISEMLGLSACKVIIPDENGRLRTVVQWPAPVAGEDPPHRVAVPLMLEDRSRGVLMAYRDAQGLPFSADELRVLRACADQVAVAMERERLMAEEQRAALLEESDRMKSALLSSMSHELRTPLSVIRAAAGGMLEAPEMPPALRELALSIDREASRLDRLVGNLLDMSRIEAGVLRPHPEPQALDEIVGAVLQRLRPLLGERPVLLDFPPDLPLVAFDALQIDQVLTNLLDNACKFSPPGTEIQVGAAVEALQVRVWVRNRTCRPLSDEELRRVFDKFYRAGGENPGSGLGLTICKAIVEAHGGSVRAARVGEGQVEFSFALPLQGTDGR